VTLIGKDRARGARGVRGAKGVSGAAGVLGASGVIGAPKLEKPISATRVSISLINSFFIITLISLNACVRSHLFLSF
jgi:hypothetical protein